jgi:hypothetical protein
MSSHYGFFSNDSNDVCHTLQGVYITSSTSPTKQLAIKGIGHYLYTDNFRLAIALFGARVLSKPTWINNSDRYIGKCGEI